LVCFRIGKETFGVDIFAVREIVRVQDVTKIPGAPEFVLGVINLRGRIITVVDLRRQMGFAPSDVTPTSRILVIHLDGVSVGFLVDAATSVIKVPGDAIDPPPDMIGGIKADFLEGVAKLEGRLAILLNLRKVLTSGQQAAVAAAATSSVETVGAEAP
jgi:purine-binding chemotaxis protein CheW